MKSIAESKKNIQNYMTAVKSQTSIKSQELRPALQLLNNLTAQIAQENLVAVHSKKIAELQQSNRELTNINAELIKQLDIEKRLRKVWNRDQPILYEDLEGVKEEIGRMRSKYEKYQHNQ